MLRPLLLSGYAARMVLPGPPANPAAAVCRGLRYSKEVRHMIKVLRGSIRGFLALAALVYRRSRTHCRSCAPAGIARHRCQASAPGTTPWPQGLPVYDHIVIVIAENKDYDQVIGSARPRPISTAPSSRKAPISSICSRKSTRARATTSGSSLAATRASASATRFLRMPITARQPGRALIAAGRSFKGYSEDLPAIGATDAKSGRTRVSMHRGSA